MLKSLHHGNRINITIHSTTLDTFGKITSKTCDLFDTKETVMMLENKRSVHLQYIKLPNSKSTLPFKDTKKKFQQTARRCANKLCFELSQKIQLAVDTGNIYGMYDASEKLKDQPRERPPL